MNPWLRKTYKVLLGFVFVYFVTMMVILGNNSSFLGRTVGPYFTPVANLMGLNTTWNFFSPDPAHTMYLHYIVHFEDEYGDEIKEPISAYFPPLAELSDFTIYKRRMSYVMRYFSVSPQRMEDYFLPWLCKQYPEASKVQTELILIRLPTLDVASTLVKTNYSDLLKQEKADHRVFECNR